MAYIIVTLGSKNFKVDLEKLRIAIGRLEENDKFEFKDEEDAKRQIAKYQLDDEKFLENMK